jgi:hypothetical protein
MKQIWHILGKDIRRYAWALLTLLVFAGVQVYLLGTTAGLLESGLNDALAGITTFIGPVLFFFLVVLVVQEESLVDPHAYWVARPVNRLGLLLSKVLFVVLLLGVYRISETLILLLNGGVERAGWAWLGLLPALALWQPQIFLAAQTRSLPRYLLLVVALILGCQIALFLGSFWFGQLGWHLPNPGLLPPSLATHWLIGAQAAYWLLVGACLLGLLYIQHRRWLAWLLLVPAGLGALLLTPENNPRVEIDGGVLSMDEESEVGLRLVEVRTGQTTFTQGEEFIELVAIFAVSGERQEQSLWARVFFVRFQQNGSSQNLPLTAASQSFEVISPSQRSLSLGVLKASELPAAGDDAEFEIHFSLLNSALGALTVLPLQEEATYVGGGNRMVVRSLTRRGEQLGLNVAASVPRFLLEPNRSVANGEPLRGTLSFALADREGQMLRFFSLSHRYSGSLKIVEAELQTSLPVEASLEDYRLLVMPREIQEVENQYFRLEGVRLRP